MKKIIALFIGLFLLSGCRVINYENTKEGRKVSYMIFGASTKVGGLQIKTSEGSSLTLSDSETDMSAALNLATKALDKIPVK